MKENSGLFDVLEAQETLRRLRDRSLRIVGVDGRRVHVDDSSDGTTLRDLADSRILIFLPGQPSMPITDEWVVAIVRACIDRRGA